MLDRNHCANVKSAAWLLVVVVCLSWPSMAFPDDQSRDKDFGSAFDEPALDEAIWGPAGKPFPKSKSTDIVTQRSNNQRTGTSYSRELNQSLFNGGRFGYLHTIPVDGQVLAQPLFVSFLAFPNPSVQPPGVTPHPVVGTTQKDAIFIATSNNTVHAFDANSPYKSLWPRPVTLGMPDVYHATPEGTVSDQGIPFGCLVLMSYMSEHEPSPWTIGVESTPVIDRSLNRLYVSYRTNKPELRLAALNLLTGERELDVSINPDVGWTRFHRNRASLLIQDGVVYVGSAGFCEIGAGIYNKPFHGEVYAFDAKTLKQVGHFAVTAGDVDGGGIWQGSTGIAADDNGYLYLQTGNSRHTTTSTPSPYVRSNSVLRLRATKEAAGTGGSTRGSTPYALRITLADWFTPYRKLWQDTIDLDLGSSGVVLIPGTRSLIAGGKEGILYLLNGDDLGGYQGSTAPFEMDDDIRKSCVDNTKEGDLRYRFIQDDPRRDNVLQKFRAGENQYRDELNKACMDDWPKWPHIHGTPVFADYGRGNSMLFVWPEKDYLKAYRWLGSRFDTRPLIAQTKINGEPILAPPIIEKSNGIPGGNGMPGGILSATVDPTLPDSGVLFASVQQPDSKPFCRYRDCGKLYAIDPITMKELWNNQDDPTAGADKDYLFSKFVPPTIARDKVILATRSSKVLIYGKKQ